jgi:hemolysin activation/secretion protein
MMDDLMRRQELERERRKPVAEPLRREPPPAAAQPGAEAVRFMVREIRFTKSEILSAGELEAVAQEFRGRELSLADLQQLAARINDLYKGKGVVTAQAVVPPQDVTTGVVTIRLVEGRLGKVRIKGNDSTDDSYVTARLGLKPEDLMNLATLEAALVRFNRINDAQLRVELAPGERFATTDLGVLMTEPPRHDLRLTYDNMGSAATGRERSGISYLNRSVLGFRDDLSLWNAGAGQFSHSVSLASPSTLGRARACYYKDQTAIRTVAGHPLITGESSGAYKASRPSSTTDGSTSLLAARRGAAANWIDKCCCSAPTPKTAIRQQAQLTPSRTGSPATFTDGTHVTQREGFASSAALRHNRTIEGLFRGNLAWQ